MTLVLGPQVLADAESLHDVGVVHGTMLTIVTSCRYKLLVSLLDWCMELWSQEGKFEGHFWRTISDTMVRTAECSPGQHPRRHPGVVHGDTVASGHTEVPFQVFA